MQVVDGRMHMHRRETLCCRRAIQIDAGACSSTVEADQDVKEKYRALTCMPKKIGYDDC